MTTTPESISADLNRIEDALRDYATTDDNPCGGAAHHDADEALPWRLLYCDGSQEDRFATADEAVAAASNYADEMDAEAAGE